MEGLRNKVTAVGFIKIFVVTVGFISALIGIYVFFFIEKKMEVTFDVLSDTSVLDINADVTNLDITYDGESLKKNGQSLRIITLRIKNTGTESILKNHYDLKDPLGLQISYGRILEKPELIAASNDYLTNNVEVSVLNGDKVFVNDVILDPAESYVLKLLVLHPTTAVPAIVPKGKIAGIKEISLNPSQQAKEQASFWVLTFGGGVLTQLVRAIAYTAVMIGLLVLGIFLGFQVSEYRDRKKRRKIVRTFKALESYNYSHMDDAIFAAFEGDDDKDLFLYRDFLKNESRLNWRYKNALNKLKAVDTEATNETDDDADYDRTIFRKHSDWEIIRDLMRDGYVVKNENKIQINQPMKEALNLFLEYIDSVKYDYRGNLLHARIIKESPAASDE